MNEFSWNDMQAFNRRFVIRRASEPEADRSLVSNNKKNNRRPEASAIYSRVPLPLPYSPSDYQPSPTSPKHWTYFQPLAISKALTPGNATSSTTRMRSLSAGQDTHNPVTSIHPTQSPLLAIENDERQHFELVPYREWTVISRNDQRGQMVLYNPENRMVTVHQYTPANIEHSLPSTTSPSPHRPVDTAEEECPWCHRPLDSSTDYYENDEPSFMDRNYFRLLASTSTDLPEEPDDREKPASASAGIHLNVNAFNQGYYAKFFVEKRKLGRGFRGSVFLCEHELDGVKLGRYAVKKVAIGNNHPWLVKMLREVHLLERLRHPNIVSYKHSWLENCRLTKYGPEVPCLFILMECANGGNLEEYLEPEALPPSVSKPDEKPKSAKELKRERIKKQLQQQANTDATDSIGHRPETQKRLLSMTEIFSIFLDIVQGLAHLHKQHIVHRDLKPPNLLLKWDDPNTQDQVISDWANQFDRRGIPRVLISDFGECEDLEGVPDNDRTGATGTLEFMAPEHVLLDEHGRNTVEYTSKADMWSLGMVLYYLCYSTLPYKNVNDVDLLREEILAFKEVHFPKSRLEVYASQDPAQMGAMLQDKNMVTDIPQRIKTLIRALLSTDPSKRPSCQEILSKLHHMQSGDHSEAMEMDWRPMQEEASNASYRMYESTSGRPWPSAEVSGSVVQADVFVKDTADKIQPVISDTEMELSVAARNEGNEDTPMPDISFYSSKKRGSGGSQDHMGRLRRNDLRKRQRRSIVFDGYESAPAVGSNHFPFSKGAGASDKEDDKQEDTDENGGNEDLRETRCLPAPPSKLLATPPSIPHPWLQAPDQQVPKVVKTATLLLKIAMCTYPCYPYSASPYILYPVIFFATLDFWSESTPHSLLLLVIHLLWVLGTAVLQGGMCLA
ncbi:putative serine/threonine-protein kinase iks1 [Apophysomyces ossiformis]|uniref:non-specific serine/threonine protein kinase n=1 Tax=Apophysomyces ossiformis TaxID=679940 RepID=A0A8H7BJ55_9FUNG|nr:putative serine/threonine-protein kinase iks1 [Apophysomyces ossiformis]